MAKKYSLLPSTTKDADEIDQAEAQKDDQKKKKKSKKGESNKERTQRRRRRNQEEVETDSCSDHLPWKKCSFCHRMIILSTIVGTMVAVAMEFLIFPRIGFIFAIFTIVGAIVWIIVFEQCRSCKCLNACK